MDADITQLEAPTFSTINKGPPEPMLRLNWDHKTHLIGEKVINPMIHCCDKCHAPILIYGRMVCFRNNSIPYYLCNWYEIQFYLCQNLFRFHVSMYFVYLAPNEKAKFVLDVKKK